jgi:hypothetical protein
MKALIICLTIGTFLTGCGGSGGASTAAKALTPVSPGAGTPAITQPAPSGGVQLTVYTGAQTESVNGVSITLTGYCTVYESNTYCWDDGWHRPSAADGFDYWGFIMNGSTMVQGNEAALDETDPFLNTPTLMTSAITSQLPASQQNGTDTMLEYLFANGTQSLVQCTIDAQQNLDCGSFTVVIQ